MSMSISEIDSEDPFKQREADKYENPIPSREFIMSFLLKMSQPLTRRVLFKKLGLCGEEAKLALKRRVRAMVRDKQLILIKGGQFWVAGRELPRSSAQKRHSNRLNQSKPNSYELGIEDIPHLKKILGRVFKQPGHCFIIPHDKEIQMDVPVLSQDLEALQDGQMVWAELIRVGEWEDKVAAQVIEILGDEKTSGIEIESAIRAYDLPSLWSETLLKEISVFKSVVPDSEKKDRVDLRSLPLITIDGEDAKDFDDAVYCEKTSEGNYRLLVAIADVSAYVKPGMALDQEALNRGTSVYFPGRVLPMLPEILSNELCSLKPQVERLCLVCDMLITPRGEIVQFEFFEGLICSQARLTYTEIAALLGSDQSNTSPISLPNELVGHIKTLEELYERLRVARTKRGALDFDSVETKILFNEQGKIRSIEPQPRNKAHKIIEESMLCANVCAAAFLSKHRVATLYRTHDGPSAEKLGDLKLFLKELGLKLGRSHRNSKENPQNASAEPVLPTPKDYAQLLADIQNRPDARVIENVLLRSLSQAVYSTQNIGHFGLAYEQYCHFTSPIRRYPDLLVHRQIKAILHRQKSILEQSQVGIEAMGIHCSLTERRADEATRDVTRWLKCQYIAQHVGDAFQGIISGVTRFGFFVELQALYIDGLVHVASLQDDYYEFDSVRHRLVGSRSGRLFELGQTVEVKVADINIEQRKIDFDLITVARPKKSTKQPAKKALRKAKSKNR